MNDMPEVRWVQKYNLLDGPQPIETGPVTFLPVLTLDQIEAWLKQSYGTFPDYWSDERVGGHINAIDDLLVQVQAWREETK